MEHRKFLQRLDELVAELTHAQAQKVIAARRLLIRPFEVSKRHT